MNRFAALMLVLVAACAGTGDETVIILQNQNPGDSCEIPATPSDSYIGAGTIEVSSPTGYLLTPVAQNFATGEDEIRSAAFVEGIRVDIHFPNDEALEDELYGNADTLSLVRFEIPYNAMIDAGGTTSFIAEIVPEQLLAELEDEVDSDTSELLLIDVRLRGQLGGDDFESSVFRYPVEVCDGCLVTVLPSCSAIPDGAVINPGGACNLFQDFALDCCVNSVNQTLCPAVPEDPA